MKMTFKSILITVTLLLILLITGCSTDRITLSAPNNATTISQGESMQLVSNDQNAKYEISSGSAVIDANGLLKCNVDAEVGSKITILATSSIGTAKLVLTVTASKVTAIDLVADSETIKYGQSVELSVKYTPESALPEEVSYEIIQGAEFAEINEGVVTIKTSADPLAIIGEKIIVKATTKLTKVSDQVEIEVVKALVSELVLKSSSSVLAYGKQVTLSADFIPAFLQGSEEYQLSVVKGSDLVTLNDHVLEIVDGLADEAIKGQKVTLRCELVSNSAVFAEIEIALAEREAIDLYVEEKYIIAGVNQVEALLPKAYDEEGTLLSELTIADFSFVSDNENILTIDENGVITPVGHGKATVTVKLENHETYGNSQTTCDVYVMVVPEAIELIDLSSTIMSNRKYYYSNKETLSLNTELTIPSKYQSAATLLNYSFELLNDANEVIASGAEVAEVNDGQITFKQLGNVKVTVSTNSSLNAYNTAAYEKSTSIVVAVNDGYNIRTLADLQVYAANGEGKAANIINDLYMTKDVNFGVDGANRYASLEFTGDRYLYGNGYIFSLKELELVKITDGENAPDLFIFKEGSESVYTVEIYDFEVLGIVDVNGQYSGNVEAFKGMSLLEGDKVAYGYRRALRIGRNIRYGKYAVKDLVMSNVKVSGFEVGIRLEHIVDGYVTDINISQCLTNGIESNQNIITFNNIYVGQVGAFAIEMVPDDVSKNSTTGLLETCAGLNFNETPKTTLTGYIKSINYNNGQSTPYMSSLNLQGNTIPDIITMIVNQKVQGYAKYATTIQGNTLTEQEWTNYLTGLVCQCLFKDADVSQKLINFFLLVFIDPTNANFAGFSEGNKNNLFGVYQSDEADGNMITVEQLLEGFISATLQGQTYTAYQNYKYIRLDLDLTAAGLFNLGETVVVNEAYKG